MTALAYGVRIPVKESAMLGRSAVIVGSDGTRTDVQVWAAADPKLIGATKTDGAWFYVASDSTVYVGSVKHGARLMERRDYGDVVQHIPAAYVGAVVIGSERGETVPELEIPAAVVKPVRKARKAAVRKPAKVATPAVVPVSVVPATVPAPMPRMTRAARQASNRELAAAMRAAGIKVTPENWAAAKAGQLEGFTFTTAGV